MKPRPLFTDPIEKHIVGLRGLLGVLEQAQEDRAMTDYAPHPGWYETGAVTIPDDRGATALAERLHHEFWDDTMPHAPTGDRACVEMEASSVAAILGERAVFLPDGLDELLELLRAIDRIAIHDGGETGPGTGVCDGEDCVACTIENSRLAALLRSTSPEQRTDDYFAQVLTVDSPEPRP